MRTAKDFKFRVWNADEKIMIYTGVLDHYLTFIQDMPLMQFTSMRDSENNDIYESDIVEITSCSPSFVKWANKRGWYLLVQIKTGYKSTLGSCHEDIKVIGNIYENPELLEIQL
jgi:hypothetical protein